MSLSSPDSPTPGSSDRFADHFSKNAAQYAAFRPTYPKELIEHVAATAQRSLAQTDSPAALARGLVWDAGTGSGQAAVKIADHFACVVATDASAEQIAHAQHHPNVEYRVAREFDSGLESGSVALVTCAQALHWFDVARFHAEVKRVLAPGGVIAEWCYGRVRIVDDPELDKIVEWFHRERVGKYWPPERRHVDNGYVELEFPFERVRDVRGTRDGKSRESTKSIDATTRLASSSSSSSSSASASAAAAETRTRANKLERPSHPSRSAASSGVTIDGAGELRDPPRLVPPQFMMKAELSLDDLLAYIATWSSTIRGRKDERVDPLDDLHERLAAKWKNAGDRREITWPVELRLGVAPGTSEGGSQLG